MGNIGIARSGYLIWKRGNRAFIWHLNSHSWSWKTNSTRERKLSYFPSWFLRRWCTHHCGGGDNGGGGSIIKKEGVAIQALNRAIILICSYILVRGSCYRDPGPFRWLALVPLVYVSDFLGTCVIYDVQRTRNTFLQFVQFSLIYFHSSRMSLRHVRNNINNELFLMKMPIL